MTNSAQSEKAAPRTRGVTPPVVGAARLLTPEDVAEFTGLSVETLAQWRSQKRGIPYVKISRNCVRYRQSDLDGWLSERIVRTDVSLTNTGRYPRP
jgi:excisionase family DNA binding protein